jgi:hypothetical protein
VLLDLTHAENYQALEKPESKTPDLNDQWLFVIANKETIFSDFRIGMEVIRPFHRDCRYISSEFQQGIGKGDSLAIAEFIS